MIYKSNWLEILHDGRRHQGKCYYSEIIIFMIYLDCPNLFKVIETNVIKFAFMFCILFSVSLVFVIFLLFTESCLFYGVASGWRKERNNQKKKIRWIRKLFLERRSKGLYNISGVSSSNSSVVSVIMFQFVVVFIVATNAD